MKIKKILAALLVAVMAISLTSCGSSTQADSTAVPESVSEPAVESEAAPVEDSSATAPVESESESVAEPETNINMEGITYNTEMEGFAGTVNEAGELHFPVSDTGEYTIQIDFPASNSHSGTFTVEQLNGEPATLNDGFRGWADSCRKYNSGVDTSYMVDVKATDDFVLTLTSDSGVIVNQWTIYIDN